jgi:hypothetical protein
LIALWAALAAAGDPHLPHGPGVRWRTVETRFFRIHWAEGADHRAEATAARAAAIADSLLLRIAADAAFVPRGPYDLVVSDATDGMTAWSVPAEGRVVIGADPQNAVLRLRGRIDWVEDALAHELGHLVWDRRANPFANPVAYGVEAVGIAELGPLALAVDVFAVHDLPYGLAEGLAELASERAGVNAFDERRLGLVRASALAGRLLSWDEWRVGADKGDVLDAERAYQQGYHFARWLRSELGDGVLRDLAAEAARGGGWARAFRRVTGEDGRTWWGRHRAHLLAEALAARADARARAAPAPIELEAWPEGRGLSRADADALAHPREPEARRESSGTWELWPRTSPDGRFYAEGKSGAIRVVKTDRPTAPEGPTAWLPAETGLAPVFRPDRDALLVVTTAALGRPGWAPRRPETRTRVWEVGLDVDDDGELLAATPRGLRRVARPIEGTERARDVALGPHGELVFVGHVDAGDQLWTLPRTAPGVPPPPPVRRSAFPPHTWLQGPTVSADGARLAVSVFRENRGELWLADLPSFRWERLPLPFADVLDPSFTADGRLLATAAVGDRWQVIRVDPSSGAIEALSDTLAGASTPAEGPGGDLWLAEATAWGFKASRLPAVDLRPTPLSPAPPPPREPLPTAPVGPSRPYRAEPIDPAVGPLLRVEAGPPTAGSAAGPRAAFGGWLDLRDALETWSLDAFGLLGTTSGGAVTVGWAGLGPTLSASAAGALEPEGRRVGEVSLGVDLPWSDALVVRPALARIGADDPAAGPLASARLRVDLGAADARRVGDPGPWGDLRLTAARSVAGAETRRWARAEGALGTRAALRAAVGPLDEHALATEWTVRGVATTADVDPREELGLGGDLASAWRPLAVEDSLAFPALPPWALRAEHLAVGSGRLAIPIAARARRAFGSVYVQGFAVATGIDAAAAWRWGSATPALRAAAVVEVRALARLQDRPWNSALILAQGLGTPPRIQLEVGGALP